MVGGGGQTLNLSLLSRGIGEVQQNGHEKVEVFLEPEDYFNFVRDRKRLYLPPIKTKYFAPEPTETVRTLKKLELPKTFTTRRGALLLFSEDFAIRNENNANHHKSIVPHSLDNVESLDLKTVDDLAKSILSYGKEEAEEEADVFLGFVHKKRKFANARQIRPGFSAKRYLSTWTRIWDDNLLENVISKGYITERSLFYGSMVAPSLRRRIFHDDLSHYPQPYRLMRNMLISPGSLSGYTFYMKDSNELEQVDEEEEELEPRQISRQKTRPSIAVVKTRYGVQREVNYSNLDKESQKDVLTDLLVKSAVNYALQKQQEFVETMKNPSPEMKPTERQMDAFDMKEAVESLLETEKDNRDFDNLTQSAANNLSSPVSSSTWPYDEYRSQGQLPSLDGRSRQLSTILDVSREGTGLKVLPPIGHGEDIPRLSLAPPTPKDNLTDRVTQTSPPDKGDGWATELNEDSLLKQGNQTDRQGDQIQINGDKTKLPSISVSKGPFQAQFASDTENITPTSRHPPIKALQKRPWGGSTHSLKSLPSKRSAGSVIGDGSLKGSLIAAPGGEIVRVGGSVAQSSSYGDVANLNDVTPRRTSVELQKSVYHVTDDSEAEEAEPWSSSQRSDKHLNSSSSLLGYRRSRGLSMGDLDATMSLKSFSFSRKDTDEDVASMSSFLPPVLKLEGDKDGVETEGETEVKDWDKITEYPELEGNDTNRSQVITETSATPSPRKSVRVATQASDPIQEVADTNSVIVESPHLDCPQLESQDDSSQRISLDFTEDDGKDVASIKEEMISQEAPVTMEPPVPRIELEPIPKTEITIDTCVSDAHNSSEVESGSWSYRQKKLTKRTKKKSAVSVKRERIPTSTPRKDALSPMPGVFGLPQLSIRSLSHSDISQDINLLKTPSPSRRRGSIVQIRSPTKDLGQIELTPSGIHDIADQNQELPKTNRDRKQLPVNYRHRKIMRRRVRKKSIPLLERRRPAARVRAEVKSLPNPNTEEVEELEDYEETWCESLSPTFWEDKSSDYESEYYYDDGERLNENDLAELKELSKSMSSINDGSLLSEDNRISGSGLPSNQTSSRLNSTRSNQSKTSEIINTVDEEPVTEEGIVNALTEHAQAIAEHILIAGGGMDLEEDIRKAALLWMKTHPARKISRSQSVQEMSDSHAVDAVMKAQRINSAGPTTAEYKDLLKKSITNAVANATGLDVEKLALESDISDDLIEALVNQEISPDDVKVVKDPLTGRSQLTTSRSASLKDGHLYAKANGEESRTVSIPSARSSVKDLGDVDIISYMPSETIDLSESIKSDHSDSQSKGSNRSKPGSSHSKPGSSHSKPASVTGETVVTTPPQEVVSEVAEVKEVKVTEPVAKVTEPAEVVEAKSEEPVSILSKPVEKSPEPQTEKEPIQTEISRELKGSPESTKNKPVKLEEREQFVVGKAKQDKENEKLYGVTDPPPRKTSIAKVSRKPSITKTQEPPKPSTEQLPVPDTEEQPEKPTVVNEKPEKPQPVPVKKKEAPKPKPEPKAQPKPKAKAEPAKKEPEKKTKPFIPPPGAAKEPPKPEPPKKPAAPPEEKKAVDVGKPKEKKAKAPPAPKPKEDKKKKPVKKNKKAKKEAEEPAPPVVEEVAPPKPKEPSPPPPPKTTSPRMESSLSDTRSMASPESDGPDFIIIRDRSPTPEPEVPAEPVPSPPKQPPAPVVAELVEEEDEEDPSKLNLISSKDARAAKRAAAAAKKREEVERKRKDREEESRKEKERQDRERQREIEAEEARRKQEEARRLRKLQEEADRQREELESREREKRRLQDIEREKRMKEEQKRKFDEMRRRQLEEEQKRLELLLQKQAEEEERWRLEEEKKAAMEEEERLEYERRMKEEEELRIQREAEEKRRREEEAARLLEEERQKAIAEARKRMEIEARLKFNRSLQLEANGLSEHSHKLSEAFVFSYFEILQWLGLNIPEFELQKLEMDIQNSSH